MNVFSANVKNIKYFKSLLCVVKDLVIDITLVITQSGIKLTSLDTNKNILLHFELPSDNFSDYLCIVDKLIITTSSQYLYKIISKISNKSSLNMCIKDEDYTDFNVRFAMNLHTNKKTKRVCRNCTRNQSKDYVRKRLQYPERVHCRSLKLGLRYVCTTDFQSIDLITKQIAAIPGTRPASDDHPETV